MRRLIVSATRGNRSVLYEEEIAITRSYCDQCNERFDVPAHVGEIFEQLVREVREIANRECAQRLQEGHPPSAKGKFLQAVEGKSKGQGKTKPRSRSTAWSSSSSSRAKAPSPTRWKAPPPTRWKAPPADLRSGPWAPQRNAAPKPREGERSTAWTSHSYWEEISPYGWEETGDCEEEEEVDAEDRK